MYEASIDKKVKELLAKLTLREKIGQLVQINGHEMYIKEDGKLSLTPEAKQVMEKYGLGAVWGLFRADWWTGRNYENGLTPDLAEQAVRLFQDYQLEHAPTPIPLLFAEEGAHGLMALDATVFPTGLGQASTWNRALIREMADAIREECRAVGVQIQYGPILDIAQDPRWSRVEEGYGEDPYLTGELGAAFVKGVQGETWDPATGIISTLKHFAGHGAPEGGHNSATSHMGERELRDIHLPAFRKCVEAGALSLMSSYNDIDGVPCSGSRWLLTDVLRGEWGFEGFVVSDSGSVIGLRNAHSVAEDEAQASAIALEAGVDLELTGEPVYLEGLQKAIEQGLIDEAVIDQAVYRLLYRKFEMGLFENPYSPGSAPQVLGCEKHRDIARRIAEQSVTLLSNKDGVLPLKDVRSLAVIGPNADTAANQLGDYTAPQKREAVVTVLDGIRRWAGDRVTVNYAKGCRVRSMDDSGFGEAVAAAEKSDAVVLVLGGSSAPDADTGFLDNGAARVQEVKESSEFDKDSGEGYDRASLRLAGRQMELLRTLKSTGKKIIVVLIQGRPLILNEVTELADAVLLAWFPGWEGGTAVAEAIAGEINPSGKLPVSIPMSEGQLPVYYNGKRLRNNYVDCSPLPQFPFGYGLSYTTFAYSDLSVRAVRTGCADPCFEVEVTVQNTGGVRGDEVVELYVTDLHASVVRPHMELKGFERVTLEPGESKRITLPLTRESFAFYNAQLREVVEPGRFRIGVGGSLDNLLTQEIQII